MSRKTRLLALVVTAATTGALCLLFWCLFILGWHCFSTVTNNIKIVDETVQETENVKLAVEMNDPEIGDPDKVDKYLFGKLKQLDGQSNPKIENKLSGESSI